jgi:7-carboxy-7-deazaguanine synthase
MALHLSECFSTIQGEAKYAGYPTTFVRLHGCNMLCNYCDTLYAVTGKKYKKVSVETIVNNVMKMRNRHVCLTGGEPLLQDEAWVLLYELVDKGFIVNVETNGGIPLERREFRSFSYTMDVKTPCSGMVDLNVYDNLAKLTEKDEVKFVCSDIEDYTFAKEIIRKYPTRATLIISPLFRGKKSTIMEDLANWLIEDKIPNMKLGVQLHKIIGVQ